MKVIRIIVGIFGCLLALSSGGCGLIFLPMSQDFNGVMIIALFSGVPTIIGLMMAGWAFRKRPS